MLFLLGFYIGRRQLFAATEANLRLWVRVLIVSAVAFAPLYTLKEAVMGSDAVICQTAGTAFDMWQKLAFTMVLVSSFVLLYQNGRFRSAVGSLRFYGRMSLTNYISQSVIGAVIYFPVRPVSRPVLRLHVKPAYRDFDLCPAGEVLQMVAGQAQAGAA